VKYWQAKNSTDWRFPVSGIVGVVHFDGAPLDRHLLRQMADFMAFRGPDAQEIWIDGSVGFGHALLKTTDDSERERQPFTLDGRVCIVADARVDARSELIAKLKAKGHDVSSGTADVELILRAYQVWDENCVEHLLGDFAFAIWNVQKQRLFCARDHLGVKPFFYAQIGQRLIFSNTLDCVRQHPAVSDRLNDLAIADFLLFDLNQDKATTSFADIQRLPPAHYAKWSVSGALLHRYWTLPIDEPVYFRKADDYVDRFKELLEKAVDDRLRTKKVGVFMSGGLDSPILAATACKILRGRSPDSEVRAFTTVRDGIDGNERYYAGLVAERLGIPINFRDLTEKVIDPDWDATAVQTPEPVPYPMNLVSDRQQYRAMSGYSRVWFFGEGPDNALRYEWQPYLSYLIWRRHFGQLARKVGELFIRPPRIPFLPRILRRLKAAGSGESEQPRFPEWLEPDFASRLQLRERWEANGRSSRTPCPHPLRPCAYKSFEGVLWEYLFSQLDAEAMGTAFEVRHPFVDLRLLRYLLAVPVVPWCREKYLVRRAMQEVLPTPVLRRPKSPLTSDPAWEGARRFGLTALLPAARFEKYVDSIRVPKQPDQDMTTFRVDLRPRALNYWLRNLHVKAHAFTPEKAQNEYFAEHDRGGSGKETRKNGAVAMG
jgi:asparagine synthase (glutamine-hydrolysing)